MKKPGVWTQEPGSCKGWRRRPWTSPSLLRASRNPKVRLKILLIPVRGSVLLRYKSWKGGVAGTEREAFDLCSHVGLLCRARLRVWGLGFRVSGLGFRV